MFPRLASISFLLASLLAQVVVSDGNHQSLPSLNSRDAHQVAKVELQSFFGDLDSEINLARRPLDNACRANDANQVVIVFTGLQKSFRKVAAGCSKAYNISPKLSTQFATTFVQILNRYQYLLITLKAHPKLLKRCAPIFKNTSIHINAMVSFFNAGKIQFKPLFTQINQAPDLRLYSQCGLQVNISL